EKTSMVIKAPRWFSAKRLQNSDQFVSLISCVAIILKWFGAYRSHSLPAWNGVRLRQLLPEPVVRRRAARRMEVLEHFDALLFQELHLLMSPPPEPVLQSVALQQLLRP